MSAIIYKMDIHRIFQEDQDQQQLEAIDLIQTTIHGKRISGDPVKFMRQLLQKEIMEKYYKKKIGVNHEHINWSVFAKALKKKRAKGALLKMIHGLSPTQQYLTKMRLIRHAECPCCSSEFEEVFHILRCKERC